ncbi:MAG: hypothetical protein FD149_1065 [Rhodospirillaceae bacterium]|nr:MAG: hypothetical protein FD149_1065 [Rhodospirillaceae bacterium]
MAAVAGAIVGAKFGVRNIPPAWLNKLAWVEVITDLATGLLESNTVSAQSA